jgi:hypothetical protein
MAFSSGGFCDCLPAKFLTSRLAAKEYQPAKETGNYNMLPGKLPY